MEAGAVELTAERALVVAVFVDQAGASAEPIVRPLRSIDAAADRSSDDGRQRVITAGIGVSIEGDQDDNSDERQNERAANDGEQAGASLLLMRDFALDPIVSVRSLTLF